MNKKLALLSLVALFALQANTCFAAKIQAEVEVGNLHDVKVWATKTGLYATPFLLSIIIANIIQRKDICDLTVSDTPFATRNEIIQPLIIGAFAAYLWPKANKIK